MKNVLLRVTIYADAIGTMWWPQTEGVKEGVKMHFTPIPQPFAEDWTGSLYDALRRLQNRESGDFQGLARLDNVSIKLDYARGKYPRSVFVGVPETVLDRVNK